MCYRRLAGLGFALQQLGAWQNVKVPSQSACYGSPKRPWVETFLFPLFSRDNVFFTLTTIVFLRSQDLGPNHWIKSWIYMEQCQTNKSIKSHKSLFRPRCHGKTEGIKCFTHQNTSLGFHVSLTLFVWGSSNEFLGLNVRKKNAQSHCGLKSKKSTLRGVGVKQAVGFD